MNPLIEFIRKDDYFGFADGKEGDKYLGGLQHGRQVFSILLDDASLLIENHAAAQYKEKHLEPESIPKKE